MIARLLEFLAVHATKFLAGGVLVGLALPPLAELLRPLLVPIIMFTLTTSLLRLDVRLVVGYARRPLLLAVVAAFVLVASPLIVWGVLAPIGLPEGLLTAVILMAAAPPITSAAAFALILGLDAELAVAAVILTHALVPFTLPPVALQLLGLDVPIAVDVLMLRLALIVGSAFAIAFVLRRWVFSAGFLARKAKAIDGLSVFGLICFAIAIMAGVTEVMLERPGYALLIVVLAFCVNAALQALGALAFWRAGRRTAFTIGHMTGNCNMGLVLAALADRAGIDVIAFFALAQLPMYMLPSVALPLYRRLMAARHA